MLEIIDVQMAGNLIRFYLGEKTEKWGYTNSNYKNSKGEIPEWLEPSDTYYGDDWDDVPYEDNAGQVYPWFVKGYIDVAVPFEYVVNEPRDFMCRSNLSMQDFVNRKEPRLTIVNYNRDDEKDYDIYLGDDYTKIYEIPSLMEIKAVLYEI